MLALLLLAQVASAVPVPMPAVTPVATPAAIAAPALGAGSASVSGKPRTLADLARERKLGRKGVAGGTLSVAGTTGMPEVVPAADGRAGRPTVTVRSTRLRNAESDVAAARRAVDEAAVRKGMTSEDTAAARRKLDEARRDLSKEREAASR